MKHLISTLFAIAGLASCSPQPWDDEVLMDPPPRSASQPSIYSAPPF